MIWRISTSPSRYPSLGSFPDVRSLPQPFHSHIEKVAALQHSCKAAQRLKTEVLHVGLAHVLQPARGEMCTIDSTRGRVVHAPNKSHGSTARSASPEPFPHLK